MAEQPQEFPGKPISEQLQDALAQLSTDQIRYIVVRQGYTSDKDAADALGMKPDRVYHWPPIVKEACRLMAGDGIVVARHVLRKNLAKAALIKAAGLDSDNERISQDVAAEILDRELGKPTQRQELGGPDGSPLVVNIVRAEKPQE